MNDPKLNSHILENRPYFDLAFTKVELALGILATANGLRSAWIDIAERLPSPDSTKIMLWKNESESFTHMAFKVYRQDKETLDYVLNVMADKNAAYLSQLMDK